MVIRSFMSLSVLTHVVLLYHILAEQCHKEDDECKDKTDLEWARQDQSDEYNLFIQKKADAKQGLQTRELAGRQRKESSLTDLLKFAAVKQPEAESAEDAESGEGTESGEGAESAEGAEAPLASDSEEVPDVLGGWYLGNDGLEVQINGDGDPRTLKTLGASYNITNIANGRLDVAGPYGGGNATWEAKIIVWNNGLVHVKEDHLAWRYLPYLEGAAVRCGPPMQITCVSDDGINCAWGKFGAVETVKPWIDISNTVGNYDFNQTVNLDCPGWMMEDGTNPCLYLGCYKAVQFGVYVKNMYQIDMSKGTFTADLVLTLKWRNPEARKLVLGGTKSVSMPSSEAADKMWMPDLAVANRDISQTEVVSSSVQVWWDGSVKKVERLLCTLRTDYDVTAFPFDEQALDVVLSSTNKMTDQMQLTPLLDQSAMSANASLFNNKDISLVSSTVKVFNETDGQLSKSRGVFTMKVKRKPKTFVFNIILPAVLVTMVGCTAFYFPLDAPFTMPRVATTLIGFLTLVTIRSRVEAMISCTPTSWLDVMFGSCLVLMLLITICNVFVEYLFHMDSEDMKELGRTLNNDFKVVFPSLLMLALAISFVDCTGSFISTQYLMLGGVYALTVVGLIAHIGYHFHQIRVNAGSPSSGADGKASEPVPEEPPKLVSDDALKSSKGMVPSGSKVPQASLVSAGSSGMPMGASSQFPQTATRGRAVDSAYPGRGIPPSPPTGSHR
mmetsp:Transcript_6487/g.12475  ORF Transcript_6487/g.12475 Transcript_6487/m.12475 type:complete len:727 (-) Transcript_6487:169-2349(-)